MSKRTWIKCKTPGVRYREHEERKHGIRPDRYFSIRYKLNGKDKEEGLGWSSQGWTEARAAEHIAELKKAQRTGEGAKTLAEKREQANEQRNADARAKALEAAENVSFGAVFTDTYMPAQRLNKSRSSCDKEAGFFRNWIGPAFGNKPLRKIAAFDLERLKKSMMDAGKSPKTIHYVLGTVRQVFNFAQRNALFEGTNPVKLVKKPTADNRRMRFLSKDEADRLLDALAGHSRDLYDMALLSLHTGMRAGEIFALTWGNVDLGRKVLVLFDTKNGKTRHAMLTDDATAMLSERSGRRAVSGPDALVFPSRKGTRIVEVSNVFQKVADSIGLNNGVTDRRQKVVFHTLRHSYASWLVERGVDLYTVKELMGHKTLNMTERYSHLSPDTLRRAGRELEAGMKANTGKVVGIATGRR